MVIKNEKEKKIAEFGKEFGKAVVDALNYQENIEESKTDLFKGSPNLKKPKTDYGALTVKAP